MLKTNPKGTKMTNIRDLLNRKAEDIEPPPLVPPGVYDAHVTRYDDTHTSARKGTPGIVFFVRLDSPVGFSDDQMKELGELEDWDAGVYPLVIQKNDGSSCH